MPKSSIYILFCLLSIGFFAPIIANEKPLWCKYGDDDYFPAFQDWVGKPLPVELRKSPWYSDPTAHCLMPIIPFSGAQFTEARSLPPFTQSTLGMHWLGTDKEGRDVLAGLIQGTSGAIFTGVLAMSIALLLGGILGGVAGYWGDKGWKAPLVALPIYFTSLFYWFYLLFLSRKSVGTQNGITFGQSILLTLVLCLFWIVSSRLLKKYRKVSVPLDFMVMRMAEVVETVPKLVLLLAFTQVMESPTKVDIVILIGVLSWPGTARLLRGELIKLRAAPFVEAARRLGISNFRVFFRHALPSALQPVAVLFALGAGQAVLIESALTFLNLGVSRADKISWGVQLQTARFDIGLVWVWLSPGIVLLILSAALYNWSEKWSQYKY